MSEKMIIRHCAPTLAGLKTGTIFNCEYYSDEELNEWIRDINRRLSKKGLRVVPLKKKNGRVMIYVYRPRKLKSDISQKDAAELLDGHGYAYEMPARCIVRLIERLATSEEFPHEIGLFLGYPPEDVKGFIENGADGAKYVGTWKVYGDVEQAKKTFSLYRKCTDIYLRQYENGHTIEKLTVAI